NAVHHAPDRSRIVVSVSAAQGALECRVLDSGPGFRDADLPHVFRPFFTRRRGGRGLGLSIAQRVGDEHRGRIAAANRPEGVAILEYSRPDGNALQLLPKLKEIDASVPLVVLTAHGSIDLAVQAMREGAEHFLTKPLDLQTLHVILTRVLEQRRIRQKQLASETREQRQAALEPFFGVSEVARKLAEHAKRVLDTAAPGP